MSSSEIKKLTPLKAIRAHCIDCAGGSVVDVRNCHLNTCPLWPHRFGKSGNKKIFTEEQKRAAAERLKRARESKNTV